MANTLAGQVDVHSEFEHLPILPPDPACVSDFPLYSPHSAIALNPLNRTDAAHTPG